MKINSVQNVLPSLLGFLGVGAIFGGGVLTASPSGKLIGMPLSLLQHSPFTTFLIPGIVLFTALGVVPLLIGYALLKKPMSVVAERFNFFNYMHWSWTYTIYCAFVLIFWLQIEMMFLQAVGWLHCFYMLFAVVLIFVALLPGIRKLYRQDVKVSHYDINQVGG